MALLKLMIQWQFMITKCASIVIPRFADRYTESLKGFEMKLLWVF